MATTKSEGFTAEERAAMKERAKETRGKTSGDGEADLLAKIAEMGDADRAMAERIHAVITQAAPELEPKTWYGQPAYAKDGKVVVFFQAASKFKTRYATLGFNDAATIDDGTMWPVAFALTSLTAADEKRIAELVTRAVS
ncbi:iron chaperone [Cellulomonas sp. ICMP 17802]|uniref:iron chaperone n=1 Tax=Cellulomonas sp. ICMP 17802 TaxID=3239199 RepID=UPI00351BA23E